MVMVLRLMAKMRMLSILLYLFNYSGLESKMPKKGAVFFLLLALGVAGPAYAQWKEILLPFSDTTRFKVQFVDEMHGWVSSYRGSILRTTDGGATWQNLVSPHPNKISHISFSSPDYGILWAYEKNYLGQDKLYNTVDGGLTWKVTMPFDTMYVSANPDYGYWWHEFAIHTTAPNYIAILGARLYYIGGAQEQERLYMSTSDGGHTWLTRAIDYYIRGTEPISLPLDTATWAVLDSDPGSIPDITPLCGFRVSTDRGASWNFTRVWVDTPMVGAEFTDAKHGIIFHAYRPNDPFYHDKSGISITSDGGETWNYWKLYNQGFSGLVMNDTTVYYIVAEHGYEMNRPMYGRLLRAIYPPLEWPRSIEILPYDCYSISKVGDKIYALSIEGRLFVIDNTLVSVRDEVMDSSAPLDYDIYPNPSWGVIRVIPKYVKPFNGTIGIFNSIGEKLLGKSIAKEDREPIFLDLRRFRSGCYFVVIQGRGRSSLKPFVILK